MPLTAAFFDIDGTLTASNAIHYFLHLSKFETSKLQYACACLRLLSQTPYYWLLDQINRDYFNQVFYDNYDGLSTAHCQRWSQIHFREQLYPHLFSDALACIADHQAQGQRIVLITGSLDFIVAPLAKFLNAIALTTSIQIQNHQYTGKILGKSMTGQEKARRIWQLAGNLDIDLTQSYAYSDSTSDLPMLQSVGYPVAVNPDPRLNRIAQEKHWSIYHWD